MGSGADVVSGGELLKAIKSGIKPNKIVFLVWVKQKMK